MYNNLMSIDIKEQDFDINKLIDCNIEKSIVIDKSLKYVDLNNLIVNDISHLLPVSVAESVTAGALSNAICAEPGSSRFFLGGIVAYNMNTQKKLLHVDDKYAEANNFANPFTTFTMAKNVTKIFNSRIGLSTTGFSLPTFREEDKANGKCKINIETPYAFICLYDSKKDYNKIHKITNYSYVIGGNKKIQRAHMQSRIALECKKIYETYCLKESTMHTYK